MSEQIERQITLEATEGKLAGYAAVYNRWSEYMSKGKHKFREIIRQGAIELASEVLADMGHAQNDIIGRLSRGTLKATPNEKGLHVVIDPPKTHSVYEQVERGDYEGMSFRASIPDGGSTWEVNRELGVLEHVITRLVIDRVSVVAEPAYTDTVVIARDLSEAEADKLIEESKEVEIEVIEDKQEEVLEPQVVVDHSRYYAWEMKRRGIGNK